MTSHLGIMLLFVACIATVLGTMLRDHPKEQFRIGLRIFLALVAGAYALAWLMYVSF